MKNDLLIAELKKLVPVCQTLEYTPVDHPNRASVVANIQARIDEFVDNIASLCSRNEARDFALHIKSNPASGRLLLSQIHKCESFIFGHAELKIQLAAKK